MRSWILASFLMLAPFACFSQGMAQQDQNAYRVVDADTLKSWYDQKVSMIVLDAREKSNFKHATLPNAKWIPSDASEKQILAAIPAKDSLVVAYSCNTICPAGTALAARLVAMGYKNVWAYTGGLDGWMVKGHPVLKR
jgi:rhodanese-related sulfurtransferase